MSQSSRRLKTETNSIRHPRSTSNEHFLFAESLRDWRNPLIEKSKSIPISVCSRCLVCKCRSVHATEQHHHICSRVDRSKRRGSTKPIQAKKMFEQFDIDFATKSTNNDAASIPIDLKMSKENDESKKKKRHQRQRFSEARSLKSNEFTSTTCSSDSAKSCSRKKSRFHRSTTTERISSYSDDSLNDEQQQRTTSVYLIELNNQTTNVTNEFGLTKTIIYLWKNSSISDDQNLCFPRYSVEQITPRSEEKVRHRRLNFLHLQRTSTDLWQNNDRSSENRLTSSCQDLTGSASDLFSLSDGRFISISIVKPSPPPFLDRTIIGDEWKDSLSPNQRTVSMSTGNPLTSPSDKKTHSTNEIESELITTINDIQKMNFNDEKSDHNFRSSASTDEDVDDLHSHYSEIIDRTSTTTDVKHVEFSQTMMDSGVEIISEEKRLTPHQNSKTSPMDLFGLSDDSTLDMEITMATLRAEKDRFRGYELETVTDDEADEEQPIEKEESIDEIHIPQEKPTVKIVPSRFEFKLPSFTEWVDRAFTSFLVETNESPIIPNNVVSSPEITVIEKNQSSERSVPDHDDDEKSFNDISSSSFSSEKVDYESYIINSNYEKIHSLDEIAFIKQCSSSSMKNDDQDALDMSHCLPPMVESYHQEFAANDESFVPIENSFYQLRDSALDLCDEDFQNCHPTAQLTVETQENDIFSRRKESSRTLSSSSCEAVIPKEKETGMYYPAFGFAASIQFNEHYRYEWFDEAQTQTEPKSNEVRVVHETENLEENEDEFYYSPRNLIGSNSYSNLVESGRSRRIHARSLSLSNLDDFGQIELTQEMIEQLWQSFTNLVQADRDESELNDYRLRHMMGLSEASSTFMDKSRSHNDLLSNNSTRLECKRSKSFDETVLMKNNECNNNGQENLGLLEGADISEPFADRNISTSMHSDAESIRSTGQLGEISTNIEEENEEIPSSTLISDAFAELSIFRPHSLSTIPSSRESQYESSADGDDLSESDRQKKTSFEPSHSNLTTNDEENRIKTEISSNQNESSSQQIQTIERIAKVSDLEIVKQGKGFKIGYIDRQGTDQRVILTKHIEPRPETDEHEIQQTIVSRQQRRSLNPTFTSVLHTNGYHRIEEDLKYQRTNDPIEVPMIGTNPKDFDESDMISIDIDGASTLVNGLCESIVITQGSIYSIDEKVTPLLKKERIEVTDRWRDQTVINGSSTTWRSPFKGKKSNETKNSISSREIALSPISFPQAPNRNSISTSPIDFRPIYIDRSCQCSPLPKETLERSADSGILVDDRRREKCHLALQVDIKNSSSDSEDLSEFSARPFSHLNRSKDQDQTVTSASTPSDLEQEILQLRRERTHIVDLLALNWNRSNIWVELTEAKLNYIIGETDALLRTLSLDSTPIDSETVKTKMREYEAEIASMTQQRLNVYRQKLEDSKKQLDMKIDRLEMKKKDKITSNQPLSDKQTRRIRSFLSSSVENLTSRQDQLHISFQQSTPTTAVPTGPLHFSNDRINVTEEDSIVHRPRARYASSSKFDEISQGDLSKLEGLTESQQAMINETDQLVKDSQQFHSESASEFQRARESLLSSETSIRLARANFSSIVSQCRPESNALTLAELFKYEEELKKNL